MADRRSEREKYDALVELYPWNGLARRAFAVVKKTYTMTPNGLLQDSEPIPLRHDIREPEYDTQWPTGSDVWPFKWIADVVVLGQAFAPAERRTRKQRTWVRVGAAVKSAAVFGRRYAEMRRGTVVFSEPEHIVSVPLDLEHAYGGCDTRVSLPVPTNLAELMHGLSDHPGAYPRNALGKGYVVLEEPFESPIELPQVEDPDDPLTPERFFTKTPSRWYAQPLPWTFGWTHAVQFPRSHFLGLDPLAPLPDDVELAEARRGFLPAEWRAMRRQPLKGQLPEPLFFQEASSGMSFSDLRAGTPIEIGGMHPERETLSFSLPEAPLIEIEVEGDRAPCAPHILHVVVTPHEERVEITWAAHRPNFRRAFMRGLHGLIPIRLHVDRDRPIDYVTPEPILKTVRRAIREGKIAPPDRPSATIDALELGPGVLGTYAAPTESETHATFVLPQAKVDVPSGRVVFGVVDWELVSPLALSIERHYSSMHAWRDGALGRGFSHPFETGFTRRGDVLYFQSCAGDKIRVGEIAVGSLMPLTERLLVRRTSSDSFQVEREDGWIFSYGAVERSLRRSNAESVAALVRIETDEGLRAELRYDLNGHLAAIVLPTGSTLRFEHDGYGRLLRVFAPTGRGEEQSLVARYEYDENGLLERATNAAGHVHRYRYRHGLLSARTLPFGTTYEYDYEGARCVAVRKDGATIFEIPFQEEKRTAIVIANGYGSTFSLDERERLVTHVDPSGQQHRREYHPVTGAWITKIDPLGRRFERSLDEAGHVTETSAPGGVVVRYERDRHGRLARWVGPDGRVRRWGHDSQGRLCATAIPARGSSIYEHGGEGQLVSMVVPPEVLVRFSHDASRYVSAVRGALGERRARYDRLGRIEEVRDELEQTTAFRYGPDGRVREVTLASGERITVERDALGEIVRYRDGIVDRVHVRDDAGQVIAFGTAEARVTLRRDSEGHIVALESASGAAMVLELDALGRLQREIAPHGGEVVHVCDAAGRATEVLSTSGARTSIGYDEAGRIAEIRYGDGRFAQFAHSQAGWLIATGVDDLGIGFARDAVGHIVRERSVEADIVSQVDGCGARIGWDLDGLSVKVERDLSGAPLSLRWSGRSSGRIDFVVDALGRERVRRGAAFEARFERDALGRVEAEALVVAGHTLAEARYSWAGLSFLKEETSSHAGRLVLAHDARGVLVAWRDSRGERRGRAFDRDGNAHKSEDPTFLYEGGLLLEGEGRRYRYDANGRRIERDMNGAITRYCYDTGGRLSSVELPDGLRVRITYDPLGRMARRFVERREGMAWTQTNERRFVWDGLTLLREIEIGGSTIDWIWIDGELVAKVEDEQSFAILGDPSGAPMAVVDLRGALVWHGGVDAFGEGHVDVARTYQPWRWRGHWEDPDTGLLHTLFRAYDPQAGVYLEPNPLGAGAGIGRYAPIGDPLSHGSPLGLGAGIDSVWGADVPLSFEAERTLYVLRQLDREDGAIGESGTTELPDPYLHLLGLWSRFHPRRTRPGARIDDDRALAFEADGATPP